MNDRSRVSVSRSGASTTQHRRRAASLTTGSAALLGTPSTTASATVCPGASSSGAPSADASSTRIGAVGRLRPPGPRYGASLPVGLASGASTRVPASVERPGASTSARRRRRHPRRRRDLAPRRSTSSSGNGSPVSSARRAAASVSATSSASAACMNHSHGVGLAPGRGEVVRVRVEQAGAPRVAARRVQLRQLEADDGRVQLTEVTPGAGGDDRELDGLGPVQLPCLGAACEVERALGAARGHARCRPSPRGGRDHRPCGERHAAPRGPRPTHPRGRRRCRPPRGPAAIRDARYRA